MRKVLQCIPLKTKAALAVLEDIVNGTIGRERVLREREDLLAHDDNWLISCFEGNPPGAAAAAGAQHSEEPCAACATGDVHTGDQATGAFQRELANRLGLCQSTLSRAMPAEWELSASQPGISKSHNAVE